MIGPWFSLRCQLNLGECFEARGEVRIGIDHRSVRSAVGADPPRISR